MIGELEPFDRIEYLITVMRRLRHVSLILGLLAVQLTLASDGITCVRAMFGGRTAAAPAMAGMNMTGTSPAKTPCDAPHSPVPCHGSMSCVAPFVAAVSAGPACVALAHDAVSLTVISPLSLTRLPELPPPRA